MLGVLVLVAIGAYAYLYWWSRTPDHGVLDTFPVVTNLSNQAAEAVVRRPAPIVPEAEAPREDAGETQASYRTHTNTEFGFSFEYPDTWVVSQDARGGEVTLCLNEASGTGGCLATLSLVEEGVNATEETALDALRAEFRAGRIAESSRRIGGEDATQLRVSGYPAGEEGSTRAAVFAHERRIYRIEAAPGQEAVFDRIVSSFRFQD